MIRLGIEFVKPGMELAQSIFTADGKILLNKNMKLNENYILKLRELGFLEVYVKWHALGEEKEVVDVISKKTRVEAIGLVKETLQQIHMAENMDAAKIKLIVENIIEELLKNKSILLSLTDIRAIDDYTFGHSVNVCVLALMMGLRLGYGKEALASLGMGAILHDIGKVRIPSAILNKPGRLEEDEFAEIKKHSLLGYEIAVNNRGINEEVRAVILDHHERYDGGGYPRGIHGEEIHEFARIVSICDVYDALTSNRVYRKKIPAYQAIEYLISMGNHQFDYQLVKVFIKCISVYPIGTVVKLYSEELAVVVGSNTEWPTRPLVRIVTDPGGSTLQERRWVDLSKELTNQIVETIESIDIIEKISNS